MLLAVRVSAGGSRLGGSGAREVRELRGAGLADLSSVALAKRKREARRRVLIHMTPYPIHVRQLESIPLAVIRRQAKQADLPRLVPECCGLVWEAMRAQHVKAGRHVAIYWDGSIRLEVGVEVMTPFGEQGEVVRSATPSGMVASTTHFGPYAGLGAAHDALHQWCRANNHHLAGPSWEIYGHWESGWDADLSRIRTDIYYLLISA